MYKLLRRLISQDHYVSINKFVTFIDKNLLLSKCNLISYQWSNASTDLLLSCVQISLNVWTT